MTSTAFELVLNALLDDGHEVHFKKNDGMICMRMNSSKVFAVSGETIEQIGKIAICEAISSGFKRIDGGD